MSILVEELLSMPINQVTETVITHSFEWEIYKYVLVGYGEDQEVEDVCNEVTVNLTVPRVSFIEYIDILLFYKHHNWYQNHYVTSKMTPLNSSSYPSDCWLYFDTKNGNLLFNGDNRAQVLATYYIEEFNQFAVIMLAMES